MCDIISSTHANARKRQRGFKNADVDLILRIATDVGADTFLLTEADATREIQIRKKEIQQLEKLKGSQLIVRDGILISLWHRSPKDKRITTRFDRSEA